MRSFLPKSVAALLSLTASLAAAQDCPSRVTWPTDRWPVALVDPVKKAAELAALESYLFTLTGKDEDREGLRTDGLVIIKGGAIVYERYARGFDETKRHLAWSATKSITSALVGIAVKDGALTLDDSICQHLPEFAGTPQCAITVRDTITFATGLGWQEEYEDESYQSSSVIAMFFGAGHRDHLRFILGHKQVADAGARWSYSTGDAQVAAAIAKRALGKRHGPDAFWKLLFDRIGMPRTVFEEDAMGTPLGGSFVWATPRDLAKFGWLYLNDGCWNGERVLPSGWVAASTRPSDAFVAFAAKGDKEPSGYMWWLNRPIPERENPIPWKTSPDDAYGAIGHWGQYIMVVPSADVVIVRTGDDRDEYVSEDKLISLSLDVAR
ncbi:MAG: serine hydrolase domain-containing protein [Myxococcota bacterium]